MATTAGPVRLSSFNRIVEGDCVEQLAQLPAGSVDLAFADPPFNIGYEYDVYDDKRKRHDYLNWSRAWIGAVHRVLKESGTFWLAIGDEYAAELKVASQDIGFHSRSWVIWYYTFGVNCKQKFSRSHAHLFYFVKDPAQFTFRAEDLENRIPSARQLVYADGRANPTGRLPDDTWVLRPQDLAGCFSTSEDTWYFPRVAGTFKERAGFHGCQMPEQLLGRIIRLCSHEQDLVLDPFSGSATTVAVAKKLGRRYFAVDLSPEYVARGQARLAGISVGDPLDGAAEPTVSAPSTAAGKMRGRPKAAGKRGADSVSKAKANGKGAAPSPYPLPVGEGNDADVARQARLLQSGLIEAYRRTYDGYSLDRLVADPELNQSFGAECQALGLPGDRRTWNWMIFGLRKAGHLTELPTLRRTEFGWQECDPYLFASEIAWRQLIDQGCESLDEIMCDPALAEQFDQIAAAWAPGFSRLEYRWAALKLRKSAKQVRSQAELLSDARLSAPLPLRKLPEESGIYVVLGGDEQVVYAGETDCLRSRLRRQFGPENKGVWKRLAPTPVVRFWSTDCSYSTRLAYQRRLISRHRPLLNLPDAADALT